MPIDFQIKLHTSELRRGQILRQYRNERRLSQTEIADWINTNHNLNLTQKRISAIENGSDIRIGEAIAFADCFGVDMNIFRV